jgi:hypothetical protein
MPTGYAVKNIPHLLSRTCGVSIFINYCTAPATQRKMEGGERDIQLIDVNEASSCLAQGYCVPCSPRRESGAYQAPPPHPRTPHAGFWPFLVTSAKVEDGLHLGAQKCCS